MTDAETRALLATISPDNSELVRRWAETLRQAGGFYADLDLDGLRAVARNTLGSLAYALIHGDLPAGAERRYVDPPPYRHQPLHQFVLAGLLVDRLLRDYLVEQAPRAEIAAAAMARVDPVLASALVKVVQLRQQQLGAGQIVADIGKLLGRGRNPRRAFDAACERIAATLGAARCVLVTVDDGTVMVHGDSRSGDTALPPGHTEEREHYTWIDEAADDRLHTHPLSERGSRLEQMLRADGHKHLSHRSLVTQGRLVGALIFAGDEPLTGTGRDDRVEALSPLLAAQLGYVRQTGALEQADAAIDDLFDASPNMMIELDRLGRILRTNDRFRREIGMPGDVIGMPLMWLVHPAWAERFRGLWERIEGEDRLHEARVDLIAADSRRRALALEAHWIRNEAGDRTGCLVALWNVTHQVMQAEVDRARIDELSAFAHHVAHDLQAPLRTIAGFASMLADELPDDIDPELRDYAARTQDAAERAGDLVQGLLRFAHGTRSEGRSRSVKLSVLLADVRAKLAADFEQNGGRLDVGLDEAALLGDEVTLSTMLVNLVGNALRHGRTDGRIEVGVRAAEPGWATLYVSDDGPGIPPPDRARIFEAFERGSHHNPGSGLGLAIVRRIARAHGGDVSVASTMGRGSVFSVRLPTP